MLHPLWLSPALRSSAAPSAAGRTATSFARGGGFGLLAASTAQRKFKADRHYDLGKAKTILFFEVK